MISYVAVERYKAFPRFSCSFRHEAVLVGPNSAGKSTVIEVLRGAAGLLSYARRRLPNIDDERWDRRGSRIWYPMGLESVDVESENVRHNFRSSEETRWEVRFGAAGKWRLHGVFPPDNSGEEPFFYLVSESGFQPATTRQVIEYYPSIGVVPPLTPIEQRERHLEEKYVAKNIGTRLASRHFRNLLYNMQDFELFQDFVHAHTPELRIERPSFDAESGEIDLFIREGAADREIAWVGDGVQIWLQILFHLHRLRGVDTIVLDEPEVFLHADLQRRMVRLLLEIGPQFVIATHSAELIAEAPAESIIWIDKTRRRGVNAPEGENLDRLTSSLGSGFNLRAAKALRARLCLFVEGHDFKILRRIAKRLELDRVAREDGLAPIELKGASNASKLQGFSWLIDELLDGTVPGFVLLDRDYHSSEYLDSVERDLGSLGLSVHIWDRKEIESYLLVPPAIARLSGAPEPWVEKQLLRIASRNRDYVLRQLSAAAFEERQDRATALRTKLKETQDAFREQWKLPEYRITMAPPKDVLRTLNQALVAEGHRPVGTLAIAEALEPGEVPDELTFVLERVEEWLQ